MDAHNRACTDLANKLTLKRVFFWSREPLQHIKILCAFMETCKSRGPGLLGSVFEFSMHGNPAYSNLFKRLLHKASIPLYNIILTYVDLRICFYFSGGSLKEALKILSKNFLWRITKCARIATKIYGTRNIIYHILVRVMFKIFHLLFPLMWLKQ